MSLLAFMAHGLGGLLLAWLANLVGLAGYCRLQEAHWTERARFLWPVRITAATNLVLIPLLVDSAHVLLMPGRVGHWGVAGIGACLGAMLGNYHLDREIFPGQRFKEWFQQTAAGGVLMLGSMAALIGATVTMPSRWGWGVVAVAGGYLALHFALQFGLVLKYLRWVRFCVPAGPRLQGIVEEVARSAGIPVRRTWELGGRLAQAYAFTTTRELAFSKRLLEICPDDEVKGICAHEVAHLGESRTVLAGRLVGSLGPVSVIFMAPLLHSLGLVGFVVPWVAYFLIHRFSRWLGQRMERRADQVALGAQANEGVYARALERIYEVGLVPAVNVNNRQTHPHLYDRMLAAGVTPDYPRPAKPRRLTWTGLFYLSAMVVLGIVRITLER